MSLKRFVCESQSSYLWLVLVLVVGTVADSTVAQSRTDTIAITGQQAPGAGGVAFSGFTNAVLNNAGQVAYGGNLQIGSGGVDDTNDGGIWNSGTLVAREGSQAPGAPVGVVFKSDTFRFASPILNDAGQVAYQGKLQIGSGGVDFSNDRGNWRDSTLVAREGFLAGDTPSGTLFADNLGSPLMNNAGQMSYRANLQIGTGNVQDFNNTGAWRDDTVVVREGSQAVGAPVGASFAFLDSFVFVINDAGQTAFFGGLRENSGGVNSSNNAIVGRDDAIVAREGDQAPGTPFGVVFDSFNNGLFTLPKINNAGQVAFRGILRISVGGVDASNNLGIWRDDTLVARAGDPAPGTPTGAVFGGFQARTTVLNDAGQTAFIGSLRTDTGGVDLTNDVGIWRDSTLVVRESDQAAGTPNGVVFQQFFGITLNAAGQMGYFARVRSDTGGVDSTNDDGIWITGTNGQTLLVAREGDSLTGRTISSLGASIISGGSDGFGRSLNNFSQVAYQASFTNGDQGVFLFTPEIHWTDASSGSWSDSNSWTIGQLPGDPHDVFIDPANGLTITGPSQDTTMRTLTIGATSAGVAELNLQNGVSLTVTDGVSVQAKGSLSGNGNIVGDVSSDGRISPGNSPGEMTIAGDLTLGNGSELILELAGTTFGSEYDHLNIAGLFSADGTLTVQLLNGFIPQLGQTFDLLDFVSVAGVFDTINLPTLGGGLAFDTSSLLITGSIAVVVPEPATLALLAPAVLMVVRARSTRRR